MVCTLENYSVSHALIFLLRKIENWISPPSLAPSLCLSCAWNILVLGPSLPRKQGPLPSCPTARKGWQPQLILGTVRSLSKVEKAGRREGGGMRWGSKAVCSTRRCICLQRTGLAPALLR